MTTELGRPVPGRDHRGARSSVVDAEVTPPAVASAAKELVGEEDSEDYIRCALIPSSISVATAGLKSAAGHVDVDVEDAENHGRHGWEYLVHIALHKHRDDGDSDGYSSDDDVGVGGGASTNDGSDSGNGDQSGDERRSSAGPAESTSSTTASVRVRIGKKTRKKLSGGRMLSRCSKRCRLLVILFVCFLTSAGAYAFFFERNYAVLELAQVSWFVTGVVFLYQAVFSYLQILIVRRNFRKFAEATMPSKTYFILGLVSVASQGFSALSLRYVNYPTNVIVKSCKLLPVMLGSIILLKSTFGIIDVFSCLLMSLGVSAFVLAGKDTTPNFSFMGISALVASVCADGLLGNLQKRIFQDNIKTTTEEITSRSATIGAGVTMACLILTGNFWQSAAFVQSRGTAAWLSIGVQSFLGYINSSVVMLMVKEFDPLTAVSITTLKKIVSIVVSFAFFSKPFTLQYLWSGSLVAFGLYVNVFSKIRRRRQHDRKEPELAYDVSVEDV